MKINYSIIFFAFAVCMSSVSAAAAQTTPVPACIELPTTIKLGSKDAKTTYVKSLQTFLVSKGYLADTPTGYYGNKTVAAVKAFQKANKIDPTGIAGPLTRAKIQETIGACSNNGVVLIKTTTATSTTTSATTTTSSATVSGGGSTVGSGDPSPVVPVVKVVAPDVTWGSVQAKNVTKTSAKLEAVFTSIKAYTTYVKWGTGGTYSRRTGGIGASGASQTVSYDISGLSPNTTYNFQFFVEDATATQKTSVMGTFTTPLETVSAEVVTKVVAPKIESLSANQIEPNMSLVIYGSNFESKGNSVYIFSEELKLAKIGEFDSPDKNKIQLVLPWSVTSLCDVGVPMCTQTVSRLLPGYFYNIYVTNTNGKSAAVTIKVIGNQ